LTSKARTAPTGDIHPDPARWVDDHGDMLYRYAVLRVGNRELAEELVQETFLAGLEGLNRFQGQSSMQTWLVGILKHKIMDHFRRVSRARLFDDNDLESVAPDDLNDQMGEHLHWKANPHLLAEEQQLRRVFEQCLDALPPLLRSTFVLREVDGFAAKNICKELGLSSTNLWVRLYRARLLLRRCVEKGWFAAEQRAMPMGSPKRGKKKTRSEGRSSRSKGRSSQENEEV